MTDPSALDAQSRDDAWVAIQEPLDVLVVGGGVVGAGIALDAATRGLRVGLVEARDWASGTSSRSSKLIHGGLRYLEMLDFRLVREALTERGLLLQTLAPHLVEPVRFLYPLTHRFWERFYVGAGLLLYDTLSMTGEARKAVPLHKHLTRRGALRQTPSLRPESLTGALTYYDAKVDDARHTMMVVRTAAAHGAHCLSRVRVDNFLQSHGAVTGAHVTDLETGASAAIHARVVINATGVWTDDMQAMVGNTTSRVRASKGIHIVVDRDKIDSDTGMILRTEKSVLFVIPWGERWIIGTTDTDWTLDRSHPVANAGDIDYLLEHINTVLEKPIVHSDVIGVYAGLRPLVKGTSESTAKLSREHIVVSPKPRLIMIAGGKYTTYRVMAKDAVDAASGWLPGVGSSVTDETPLVGAERFQAMWRARDRMAAHYQLPVDMIAGLLRRYGSLVEQVLTHRDFRVPLDSAPNHLVAEVRYAVTHEGALHLDDVLTRRTRISIETPDRGTLAAAEVARIMAGLLGWTEEHTEIEINTYLQRVSAERTAQGAPSDIEAEHLRLMAPDILPVP